MTKQELAKMIDHTLLKATATDVEIERLCQEALENNFASVCVNPAYVSLAAQLLKNSDVKVCTVIGFPLGANSSAVKAFETKNAIENGADEIDMVINIGALKSGNYDQVLADIKAVVNAAGGHTTKVIIETCYLTNDEKIKACELAKEAGANFVKTSTGFGSGGATVEDVKLMRATIGQSMKIKASGGIHSYDDAIKMILAGADRLGASAGVKIVKGLK